MTEEATALFTPPGSGILTDFPVVSENAETKSVSTHGAVPTEA